MYRTRSWQKRIALWAADTFVTIVIFCWALYLRFGNLTQALEENRATVIMILFWSTLIGFGMNLNVNFMGRGRFKELSAVIKHNFILDVGLLVSLYIFHISSALSRLVFFYFAVLNVLVMFLERIAVKAAADHFFNRKEMKRKMILISDEDNLNKLVANFNPGYKYEIVGFFKTNDKNSWGYVGNEKYESETQTLAHAVVTDEFDDVLIYAPSVDTGVIHDMMMRFSDMGVTTHLAMEMPEDIGQKATVTEFGSQYIFINYADRVFDPSELFWKRVLDIIGSIIGLALTGIIFLFVAPAIKLDSPGPIFFAQTRVGKNGRRFKFYKFRSMYVDAEERKKELMKQNKMDGLMFKMDDDPRITKVGKFIRKTSLDEFPQFWNVFKGDMSLVGTRPPTVDEFMHYDEHYRKRLSMKPGITGLWQVSGRSDITDFDEVAKLDVQYIENWSLSEDIRILLKTVAVVFSHKGAE